MSPDEWRAEMRVLVVAQVAATLEAGARAGEGKKGSYADLAEHHEFYVRTAVDILGAAAEFIGKETTPRATGELG